MRATIGLFLALLLAASAACTSAKKESWRGTGRSWSDSGNSFLRALGDSIQGKDGVKEEWREFGRDTRDAGKSTATSIGESVKPPEGSR